MRHMKEWDFDEGRIVWGKRRFRAESAQALALLSCSPSSFGHKGAPCFFWQGLPSP